MVEWFKNLSEGWQTALFGAGVVVGLAAIGGLFRLFKLLFRKNGNPSVQQTKVQQRGTDNTAIVTKGNGATVAGRDVHIGIEPDNVLDRYERTLKQLGQSEERAENQQETIKHLEEELSQSQIMADTGRQQVPQRTQEAKDLAAQIEDDAGPYALALKAIATGNTEEADELLDQTQGLLDTVQEQKDKAQAKIYMARMQNASYAGRPQDALEYCDRLATVAGDDSGIMNNIATVYFENARYVEAEPLMARALKIDEASLGKDHPDVARDLNNLAQLYQATNRLKEAEPLIQRVVEILENPGGQPLSNYAGALNNLAQLYKASNRLKEAEPLMQRALKIDEAASGKDHPQVAIRLNNLAQLYKATNRLKEAEPLMKRVVEIFEKSLGEHRPKVATALNNLAQLYKATNRLKEAEPLMARALKIDEASSGKDHPKVAIRLNNLAQLYKATNRLKEAERLMKRVVEIFEKALGEDHPKVATALNNLAQLYQATDRLKEAEPLMVRALKIDEASLGKNHPDVARDLNNLALLYQATNRLKEAERLMERILVILLLFTRRTGHPHPHLDAASNNYGGLLMQMGHSKDQVAARLKRLAPEMFESTDKEVKEE